MAGSGLTGFLQNFGGGEMIVILVVALVVLGPERLPDMARSAGRMLHRFKTMTSSLSSDVREVIDDPAMQPLRELGELAARPRQKLAEYALEAEAEERARQERDSVAAAPGPDPAAPAPAGPDEPAPPGALDGAAPPAEVTGPRASAEVTEAPASAEVTEVPTPAAHAEDRESA